jgi:hypothetical protein
MLSTIPVGDAERAGGLNELHLLVLQGQAAHEAHQWRPAKQSEDDRHHDHARLVAQGVADGAARGGEQLFSQQREDQRGEGEHEIGEAAEQRIDPAATEARCQPNDDTKHGGDHGPHDAHDESRPQAVDHGAEEVVPVAVGTQEMRPARPGVRVGGIRHRGIDQRQPLRHARADQQNEQDDEAGHGQLVACKAAHRLAQRRDRRGHGIRQLIAGRLDSGFGAASLSLSDGRGARAPMV